MPGEGGVSYTLIDTARKGNSNRGHLHGTALPAADRDARLEDLKAR